MANWRDEVTTSAGGNISMNIAGGHSGVSRNGNRISFY